MVDDSSEEEKPLTQKKFQKSEVSIDIDTELLNDVELDDDEKSKNKSWMSPRRQTSR